ncbi:MAG: 8-amino-7-oxononanoate synthase [Proteobacteria bacterium]|nr:8-amino-7-oxononanoate synthase [Pseudomonadota bacterium]
MTSIAQYAREKLAQLQALDLRRTLQVSERAEPPWVIRDGRRLLSFSCNDYLGLSQHPRVRAAAIAAIERYGVGAGASRLVTGNHPLYGELESRLARLKGTEAACVFGSGYLANTGIIPALVGADDLIVVDEYAHSCLNAGARLARARTITYRHNDVAHARAILAEHRRTHRHALVATDGVFSMDGDLAPLGELAEIARRHDAWLLADDAHGLGVLGNGRGSAFAAAAPADIPLHMGTLSKALGSYGAYLCADQAVIDLMKNRARTLIYSTALPPAMLAAAIAAIDLIAQDPAYAALPLSRARAFTALADLPPAASCVVPVVVGTAADALSAARLLEDEGFLVVPIRPPTVPANTARLRLAFSALHPEGEIARLAEIIKQRVTRR